MLFYVPGGGFQQFPARRREAHQRGQCACVGLHYTPTGKPEKIGTSWALWFSQTPPHHEVITKRIGEAHIIEGREFVAEPGGSDFPTIPPFADDWRITAITPFQDDVTLYGLWPHMHLRGKDMTFIATYPDGREDVLLHVPKYDFRWQLQYELVRPVHLPAGSTIKAIGHYDNSAGNRHNPAPDEAVHWSEQSSDEMFNGWMELSIDRNVIAKGRVHVAHAREPPRQPADQRWPPGIVSVRNADGTIVASARDSARPLLSSSRGCFEAGQKIRADPTGSDIGDVTVTLYDVPPDVMGSVAVDGLAVGVTTTEPGQNGVLTFQGEASQRVTVHVIGNRVGSRRDPPARYRWRDRARLVHLVGWQFRSGDGGAAGASHLFDRHRSGRDERRLPRCRDHRSLTRLDISVGLVSYIFVKRAAIGHCEKIVDRTATSTTLLAFSQISKAQRKEEKLLRPTVRLLLASILLLGNAANGLAQQFTGGIRGAVRDANGVIPGAAVTVTNEATSVAARHGDQRRWRIQLSGARAGQLHRTRVAPRAIRRSSAAASGSRRSSSSPWT